MNTFLGTTLMATALVLGSGSALADEIREARAVDARVSRVKLDGVVDLVVRQGAKPSLVISGERADVARVTTASMARRWKSTPSAATATAAGAGPSCAPN